MQEKIVLVLQLFETFQRFTQPLDACCEMSVGGTLGERRYNSAGSKQGDLDLAKTTTGFLECQKCSSEASCQKTLETWSADSEWIVRNVKKVNKVSKIISLWFWVISYFQCKWAAMDITSLRVYSSRELTLKYGLTFKAEEWASPLLHTVTPRHLSKTA